MIKTSGIATWKPEIVKLYLVSMYMKPQLKEIQKQL
jgi:hypothetical protein